MSFTVVIEPGAEAEIDAAYDSLAQELSMDSAERWLDVLADAVTRLAELPARCARSSRMMQVRQYISCSWAGVLTCTESYSSSELPAFTQSTFGTALAGR